MQLWLGACSLTPHPSPGYRGDKAVQSSSHCLALLRPGTLLADGLKGSERLCPGWPSPKQISNCYFPPRQGWCGAPGSVIQPFIEPGSSLCINLRFCSREPRAPGLHAHPKLMKALAFAGQNICPNCLIHSSCPLSPKLGASREEPLRNCFITLLYVPSLCSPLWISYTEVC